MSPCRRRLSCQPETIPNGRRLTGFACAAYGYWGWVGASVSAERAAPATGCDCTTELSLFCLAGGHGRRRRDFSVTDGSEQAQSRPINVPFDTPFRLDLEQQRKRAKELHRAFLGGEEAALRRFRQHHPGDLTARPAKLSDAQLVIAREVGLPSWPKLKAHIETMRGMRARIERGPDAADGDMTTLHIRCGSDIQSRLSEAGLLGDFLEYSDPLCQGPVVEGAAWLDRRAAFLAGAFGGGAREAAEKLGRAEETLRTAASRYERVVLWFEHDTYDQLNLARCLAQFADTPPRRLEMVTLEHYPGGMRFLGLGQLPPESLRLLWGERTPVSARQCAAGETVWRLLRRADPSGLAAATGLDVLPYMARAVRRHCQELPWVGDGLGLTERLVLELVAERPRRIGEVFRDLQLEREPLPWLGDLMLGSMVEAMKRATRPVFTWAFEDEDRRWYRERLTITELGRAVLAGAVDWLSLEPPERWLGGVCIRAGAPCWRWDERLGATSPR